MDFDLIDRLKERLAFPLPGRKAQENMSPIRLSSPYYSIPDRHLKAAVMALVFPKENNWELCFIERASSHPEDKHGGQIGFPGGKYEEEDGSMLVCALRETHEEIGVDPKEVTVLGELTSLYVSVSNFLVQPFVGVMSRTPQFKLQQTEVNALLSIPLHTLLDNRLKSTTDIEVRSQILKNVPYYDINGQTLWGATAMMTSEFEAILQDVY